MTNTGWTCPRCGSSDSRPLSEGSGSSWSSIIIVAGLFFFIGLFFWPAMVISVFAVMWLMLVAAAEGARGIGLLVTGGHRKQSCNRCRGVWTPPQPDRREFRLRCRSCGNERTMTRGQVVTDEDKVCGECGTRKPWLPVRS